MKVYIIIVCCILSFTQSCKVQVSLNNGSIFNASQEVFVQEGDDISVGCNYCSYNYYITYLLVTNLSDISQQGIFFIYGNGNYATNIDTPLSFQCCQHDGVWNCSPRTNLTLRFQNLIEYSSTQPLPVTETVTNTETATSTEMVMLTERVTHTKTLEVVNLTIIKYVTTTEFPATVTAHSSIRDIMTSILSANTPAIAPTVTVPVISSTSTVNNLDTINKTLIVTASVAGGVCLIIILIVIFSCLYFIVKKRKQMRIAQIQAEPQYCEVLPLEERVKVSECEAYGKLDKERVKVSECEAYGKLDKERVKVSECEAYGKLDKERLKVSECEAYGKLDQLRITRNTS